MFCVDMTYEELISCGSGSLFPPKQSSVEESTSYSCFINQTAWFCITSLPLSESWLRVHMYRENVVQLDSTHTHTQLRVM